MLVKRVFFPKKQTFTGNLEVAFRALQAFSIQKQLSGSVLNNSFSENFEKKLEKNLC